MIIYQSSKKWNYDPVEGFYGGRFAVENVSGGYHGLMLQWAIAHKSTKNDWLLVSEKNSTKINFSIFFPTDNFETLELYAEKHETDYINDLCDRSLPYYVSKYNIVLCQATLEHVYDPFSAIYNMCSVLKKNGVAIIHTHVPGYHYHPHPKDYFRFHHDWFIDIPNRLSNIELLDLCEDRGHIFSMYKKN